MTIDMKADDFLLEVYLWLMKPMNQPVQDYHEDCARHMGKLHFIAEMEKFMEQRFVSMYPDTPINEEMIHLCAVEYARGILQ